MGAGLCKGVMEARDMDSNTAVGDTVGSRGVMEGLNNMAEGMAVEDIVCKADMAATAEVFREGTEDMAVVSRGVTEAMEVLNSMAGDMAAGSRGVMERVNNMVEDMVVGCKVVMEEFNNTEEVMVAEDMVVGFRVVMEVDNNMEEVMVAEDMAILEVTEADCRLLIMERSRENGVLIYVLYLKRIRYSFFFPKTVYGGSSHSGFPFGRRRFPWTTWPCWNLAWFVHCTSLLQLFNDFTCKFRTLHCCSYILGNDYGK